MKYIIACELPSGARFAFSKLKEQFALVQIENGVVRKALAFDSEAEAETYLREQLAVAPELSRLEPEVIMMELPQ